MFGRVEMMMDEALTLNRHRLRPERRAKSRRERERGWGPASIEKCRHNWPMILTILVLLLALLPSPTYAEYTRVALKIFGMDCAICAHGVRVAVQKVEGVESVELSLERAQADIRLRAGNAVPLDRFRQIVKGNGFEPKEATVTAVGSVRDSGGNVSFEISGVGTSLIVSPDKTSAATLKLMKSALDANAPAVFEVSGIVTLGNDGKETIAVSSARQR